MHADKIAVCIFERAAGQNTNTRCSDNNDSRCIIRTRELSSGATSYPQRINERASGTRARLLQFAYRRWGGIASVYETLTNALSYRIQYTLYSGDLVPLCPVSYELVCFVRQV